LDTNFRSSKKVVEFNNAFFDYLTAENAPFYEAKDFYEDVKQKTKPTAEEGRVVVHFQEDEDSRKFGEFMLDPVLETVLDGLQRGYACKDIAVLVSSNDLASTVGAFLIANDIPVISAESLQLSASPEINVLIATLQYLVSEEDKLAKLAIVHYFTQQNGLFLEDYLQSVQNEYAFQQFLTSIHIDINRKKLNTIPLFTLVNELCRIYSISLCNPFLIRLLDECERFVTKRNGTISMFLEWWEEKGHAVALSTPQGIDAVTISTIHKSKGLEYPVVILPYSRYSNFKTKPDIFVQDHITGLAYDWVTLTKEGTPARYQPKYAEESKKTLIDQLNKLYVAHTRARTELHIITEKPNAKAGNYSKFLAKFTENGEGRKGEREKGEKEKRERRREKGEEGGSVCNVCHVPTLQKTELQNSLSPFSVSPFSLSPFSVSPFSFSPFSFSPFSLSPLTTENPHQLRGIFIHNLLSSLSNFPQNEEEIEAVTQNIEETYRQEVAHIFRKILNDKSLSPYFAPDVKVLNETSILLPNGNLMRPDRVVFLEGRVVVIDYKTGEPHASHKEQIDQYCEAIRAMGYEEVEGRILYNSK